MADRSVNIGIEVEADAAVAKKLGQLGSAADRGGASAQGSSAGKPGPSSVSQAIGNKIQNSLGVGAGGAGALGAGLAVGGAVAGAYAALVIGADKAADAINILGNSSTSNAQKFSQLATEFVPGYDKLKKFGEAVDGTTERLRRAALAYEIGTKIISTNNEFRSKETALQSQQREFAFRAAAVSNSGPAALSAYDRSTVQGEIQQAEADRRSAAAEARRVASLNASIASGLAASQSSSTQRIIGERAGAESRRGYFGGIAASITQRENDDFLFSDKAGKTEALNNQKLSNQDVIEKSKRAEAEITREIERQKQLAEARSQIRKADIEIQKTELSILQEKEARMSALQTRVGLLNKGSFELGKQALGYLKENGVENATPEILDAARALAPKFVDKLGEKAGGGRAAELAAMGIDDFVADFGKGETLDGIRKEVDKVKANISVAINLDTVAMAKELANSINPLLRALIKEAKIQAAAGVADVRIGQNLKAAEK